MFLHIVSWYTHKQISTTLPLDIPDKYSDETDGGELHEGKEHHHEAQDHKYVQS